MLKRHTHSDDAALLDEAFGKALKNGAVFELEYRIVRPDGSFRVIHSRAQPHFEDQGRLLKYTGSTLDVTDRKHAEEKLRESEERYRTLTRELQVGVVVQGPNAEILLGNAKALELLGLTEDQLLGITSFDPSWNVIHEDGSPFPGPTHPVPEAIATRRPVRGAVMGVHHPRTQDRVWLLVDAIPELNPNGIVRQVVCTFADITERKQAEEALRHSEEDHRRLVETVPAVLYSYSERTGGTYYSPQVESLLGYTAQHLRDNPMHWHDSIHPDDVPAVDNAIREGSRAGFAIEYRIRDAAGNWRWFLDRSVRITGVSGTTTLDGIAQDITERKQADDTLRQSEELYRSLYDDGPVMFQSVDRNGRMIRVSNRWLDVLGYERDEVLGRTATDFMTPASRKLAEEVQLPPLMVEADLRTSVQADRAFVIDLRMKTKPGAWRWVSTRGSAVERDAHGVVVRMVGTFSDITERKRGEEEQAKLERQFHEAQKMESVGRLAGGVAHDFNNMLGVILGNTDMAVEQVDPTSQVHHDLEQIRKAATRSSDLTRQLLAFARRQTVMPKVLDLNDTVAGMLRLLERLIGEDVRVTWLPGKGLWPLKMDPSQIDQTLTNLCVNARDAISGVGKLIIETGNVTLDEDDCAAHEGAVPGDYVRLAVSDNGCGMDREVQARVFEPFFTTKEVGKGTGLGLATVYGIVKQNNGVIDLYSEPGRGTTFTVYLPRYRGTAGDAQVDGAADPTVRGHETILVVEDEASILQLTKRMLEATGYTVLTAETPGDAIRLAEAHSGEVHLLITDVVMPEMNGRDLAKNLLSHYPGLRRLFMSGYTADVIASHGVIDEGVNFIQKPFSKRDLAAKVREVLDGKAAD